MLHTTGAHIGFYDDDETVHPTRSTKKSWFPKFTQSAVDCFRSTVKGKSKEASEIEARTMAELYYNALQSELRISNPYLCDGRETPNAELYRQSWKLDPFPAIISGEKKRRCKSESNVARTSVITGGHSTKCPVATDDMIRKKNWLKESKMKIEELFRRKYSFFTKKRTDSFYDIRKGKKDYGFEKKHADSQLDGTSPDFFLQACQHSNGIFHIPRHYDDDIVLTGAYPGCDPNIWRQKLERWAASLQCAIQVIKREESMRQEISKLRMHREILERQLEEISVEKERWRRKCIDLQKEKRRSVEGIVCRHCGGAEFQFRDTRLDSMTGGLMQPPISSTADDAFRSRNGRRNLEDDEIFKALHDLLMYNA